MINNRLVIVILAVAIACVIGASCLRRLAEEKAAEAEDIRKAKRFCESVLAGLFEEKRARGAYPKVLDPHLLLQTHAEERIAFSRVSGEYHGQLEYFVFRLHSKNSFFDRVYEFNSSYPHWMVAD